MRRMKLTGALLALALLTAACGGGGGDTTPTEEPTTSEPTATTPEPTETGTDDGEGIELEAENSEFSTDEITVAAGSDVVIDFKNQDSLPHNFSVYDSEDAEEVVFRGDTVRGPEGEITYEFTAPETAGTYFFRCDVHPTDMTGDFVVE